MKIKDAKFALGEVVATHGVLNSIPIFQMFELVKRHAEGDWGDIDPEDAKLNEDAIYSEVHDIHGVDDKDLSGRVMSVYKLDPATVIWIITEWNRSVTTVLLPPEY